MQLQAIENFYLQNEVFLGKMPLTMKKTPISPTPHANPEFVCKFCNSTYRFSLGVPANQVMSEQVILELENRIADELLQLRRKRLRLAMNRVRDAILKRPELSKSKKSFYAAWIVDFDYNAIKFERERIVYYYDDIFPKLYLKHIFTKLNICLKDKKFAGGCDE